MSESPSDQRTLSLVRGRVAQLLTASPAYQQLDAQSQRDVAHSMVKVARYLVDAGGETRDVPAAVVIQRPRAQGGLARAQLNPDDLSGTVPDSAADVANKDFDPAAAAAAAEQGTEFIRKVDFPQFVAGLIDGVFNAIVDASIRQMEAYAELVKNVAKSVDEYMKDNVTENQARDYLVDKYPDHLELDTTGGQPTVKPRADADQDALPDFFADLGLPEPIDVVDEEVAEQTLMPAARRQIAMDRQKLLLAMVMMGVNRLVVTDGQIKASVLFRIDSKDSVKRGFGKTANEYASHYDNKRTGRGFFGWFSPTKTSESNFASVSVETTQTDDSESSLDLHAKLTGDVRVNFKSDYFPLEKMTEILGAGPDQGQPAGAAPARRAPAAPGVG